MGFRLRKWINYVTSHVVMIVICAVFLFPIYHIVTSALKPSKLVATKPPVWIFKPSLKHFYRVLTEYDIASSLLISLVVALGAVFLGILVSAPASYVVQRFRQKTISYLILLVYMVPYIAFAIPLFFALRTIGWFDTIPGLLLAHLVITVPQTLWILLGFIQGIPIEPEESAAIDGCSRAGVFFWIVFPLIRPGLMVAGVLGFIMSWNNFSLALMLAGAEVIPAPLFLYNFVGQASIDWGALSASATIMLIPTIAFTLWGQDYIRRAMTRM